MSGKFALIIGNTEYADPGLAQLTAPGKDAEDFARVLKDTEIGAFDQVNIVLNQSSSASIEAIDEFFDQRMPDDLLVLYFSGHGVRDELGALYLAVKNTIRSRLRSTAIKSDYIREAMDQSRSRRQVLILDCCNSGAFAQGTKAATGVSIGTASAFEGGYGRVILTASDSTQFAWEGDKVIGETDNSLFTHYLVEGLEGKADRNGDGQITVDELYDYAYEKVRLATPKQTPSKFSTKQQGEIVLRHNMRIEDIKPIPLPDDLIAAIKSSLPFVREGAVRQLDDLLKGKNLGLALSAREALERIAEEDDSRTISRAAFQALEAVKQAEAERLAKLEAERIVEEERRVREQAEAERKAEAEQIAKVKLDAEIKAREDAQRLAAQKAEEERLAKLEVERLAKEKHLADEAEKERKAKAEAERLAEEKRRADEKAEADQLAKKKADEQRIAKSQRMIDERTVSEKLDRQQAERLGQQKETSQFISYPKWISVLWITMGWAISGAIIGWTPSWRIFEAIGLTIIGGAIGLTTGAAIGGAIGLAVGGLITASILRIEHVFSHWKSMLVITLGWAVGGEIGWSIYWSSLWSFYWSIDWAINWNSVRVIGWAIGLAVGGLITANVLRIEHVLSHWKSMLVITLGWAVGGAIGESIFWKIINPIGWTISGAIGLAISGAIGGSTMIWEIRRVKEKSQRFQLAQVEHWVAEKTVDSAKSRIMGFIETHKTFILSWKGRSLLGGIIGIIFGITLYNLGNSLLSFFLPIFLVACGLAGLITYPHKVSIVLLMIGFFAVGLSRGLELQGLIVYGGLIGIPAGALISRFLYWLKVIK